MNKPRLDIRRGIISQDPDVIAIETLKHEIDHRL